MYKKVLSIIIIANLFSIMFYSCCEEKYQILSDQFEIAFSLYVGENEVIISDSIIGAFAYNLAAEIEPIAYNSWGLTVINRAYATSCSEVYVNSFVASTAKVTLDRQIIVDGQIFEAGENLFDLDEMFTADIYNAQVGPGHIRIWFKEPFLSRSEFEEGYYEFHAYVETNRGEIIESRDTVYISL